MPYTWSFATTFAREFKNLPSPDSDKILDFIDIYEAHGLSDFSLYIGKLAPSWSGNFISATDYNYAQEHSLWHYHVGIPEYESNHPKYQTSEYLLHFQWPDRGNHITIVDLYSHYTSSDEFYFPPTSYL